MNAAPTAPSEPASPAPASPPVATRVLLIEDCPADALLIGALLGDAFAVTHTPGLREGIAAAAQAEFDLVLLDLFLGDSRGLAKAGFWNRSGRNSLSCFADPPSACFTV